jgi:hypothetical protein
MNTLTVEAPESTVVDTLIQTPHRSTTLSSEDEIVRHRAHEATRTRFQQVAFASRFARIARQVRNGTLAPQDTVDAVRQLVASVG